MNTDTYQFRGRSSATNSALRAMVPSGRWTDNSKLNFVQAMLILTVVFAAFAWAFSVKSETQQLLPQQKTALMNQAEQIYAQATSRIDDHQELLTTQQAAQFIYALIQIRNNLGNESYPVEQMMHSLTSKIEATIHVKDGLYMSYMIDLSREVTILVRNDMPNVPWLETLFKLYIKLSLFGLLIICIRHWHPQNWRRYYKLTAGEVVVLLIAIICYPVAIFCYHRENSWYTYFDYRFKKYRAQYNDNLWGIVHAYALALSITLFMMLKPHIVQAYTHFHEVEIVTVDQHSLINMWIQFYNLWVEKIQRWKKFLFDWLYKAFSFFASQIENKLFRPLLWLVLLAGHPLRCITEEIQLAHPINAPNKLLWNELTFNQSNKQLGVNYESYQTFVSFNWISCKH